MTIIYAIIDAKFDYDDNALKIAQETVFDRLVGAIRGSQQEFGSYHTFQEDRVNNRPTMEDGSEYPIAARLNSDNGQELLAHAWNATKDEFEFNLDKVREALSDLSNMEIMANDRLVRNHCTKLGARAGPTIRLYDQYGDGIRKPDDFVRSCRNIEQPWIVPAYAKY